LALAALGIGLLFGKGREVAIISPAKISSSPSSFPAEQVAKDLSPLTGTACQFAERRPFAVMYSADQVTRPLSGIGMADIVVEMPVITNGITRYMALFQCLEPKEIGSIRSARHDFIPLAKGWDAIFVHWGGSHYALDKLKQGVIDNLDALSNPYGAFWRKKGIPRPHNGFSSYQRLYNAALKLGFRLKTKIHPYVFREKAESLPPPHQYKIIRIGYPGVFRVAYRYNPEDASYLRFKGGRPQLDKLSGKQIRVQNVLVLKAKTYQIEGQYNHVEIVGRTGKLFAFIGGRLIKGSWFKESYATALKFFDSSGKAIILNPGKTWIQFIQENQKVSVF